MKMAERALHFGLNDDEWDEEPLLIQMMASINAIINYNMNPVWANGREDDRPGGLGPYRDRPAVQYFHIGDGELIQGGDQQEAEGRS